jgi:hypothetical protein
MPNISKRSTSATHYVNLPTVSSSSSHQSATPASLDGSTLTWLYRCPFVDRPEICEFFNEASLIALDKPLLDKLLFARETHPLAYLFEVKA